jgi:hypothetical protein
MDGPLTSFFVDRNYIKEKNKRPKGVKKGVVCFESSSQKPLGQLEPNLEEMFNGWSSEKFNFYFCCLKIRK